MSEAADSPPRIDDETISLKTGHTWPHWREVLDRFDCASRGHSESARHLVDGHGVSEWWAQSLTVRYEQEKGIRAPGQRSDGLFGVSASKTFKVGQEQVWSAITTPGILSRWLGAGSSIDAEVGGAFTTASGEAGKVKRVDEPSRLRVEWSEGPNQRPSQLLIELTPKGDRTTLSISHDRLPSEDKVEERRSYWRQALESLRGVLEGEEPWR